MAENKNGSKSVRSQTSWNRASRSCLNRNGSRNIFAQCPSSIIIPFNNTLLIAMQKPEATLVAGYTAWQRNFDRHVLKGEKGIRILAPAPIRRKWRWKKSIPRRRNRYWMRTVSLSQRWSKSCVLLSRWSAFLMFPRLRVRSFPTSLWTS